MPTGEDADDPALLEEARRLFYVGMTRAKRHLELLSYDKESRFVEEVRRIALPKMKQAAIAKPSSPKAPKAKITVPDNPDAVRSVEELRVGANICHRVFGNGRVTDLDDEKVGIQFAKAHKEFLLEICLQYQLLELA